MKKLLKDLISINSVSGQEEKIKRYISRYLQDSGTAPRHIGNSLLVALGQGKHTLMISAHVDTVPPAKDWSSDPFKATEKKARIYGLGACDNKASVAMLLCLIGELQQRKLPGNVMVAFTCQEESTMKGIEEVLAVTGQPDAAIVCEPTSLVPRTCQKGFLKIKALARGKSAHAASPQKGVNAIESCAEDILRLKKMKFSKKHTLLGYPTISVTRIEGGEKDNVIPGSCTFLINGRSTALHDNEYLIAKIKKTISSKIEVISKRLTPKETMSSARIVKIAEEVTGSKAKGFPAGSEMYFFRCPAIVLGPGNLEHAHKAEEWVAVSELERGLSIFEEITNKYLAGMMPS